MERTLLFILVLLFSGCSLLSRQFEIVEIESEVENDRLLIHFYTQENLTELSKSRIVQFRCNFDDSEETLLGEIYMADQHFKFTNEKHKSFVTESGRTRAGVAHYIDGYRHVAIPYKKIEDLKKYSKLECFVIGVAKAPVTFPRSNKLAIDIE